MTFPQIAGTNLKPNGSDCQQNSVDQLLTICAAAYGRERTGCKLPRTLNFPFDAESRLYQYIIKLYKSIMF